MLQVKITNFWLFFLDSDRILSCWSFGSCSGSSFGRAFHVLGLRYHAPYLTFTQLGTYFPLTWDKIPTTLSGKIRQRKLTLQSKDYKRNCPCCLLHDLWIYIVHFLFTYSNRLYKQSTYGWDQTSAYIHNSHCWQLVSVH